MERAKATEKSAVVQGEFHLSAKDSKALLNRDLQSWDALLVEGREPVYNLSESKFGFAYYAIGAISVRTMVKGVHRVMQFAGLFSTDPVSETELETNKRIDAQHREIWGYTSRWLRWLLLFLSVFASVWIMVHPNILTEITGGFLETWHSYLFFFPFLPGMVHIFSVVNPTNSRRRNEKMAENIIEYTSNNDHDRVLILVGEMHREGIADALEDEGWDVESHQTKSKLGKCMCWAYNTSGKWR